MREVSIRQRLALALLAPAVLLAADAALVARELRLLPNVIEETRAQMDHVRTTELAANSVGALIDRCGRFSQLDLGNLEEWRLATVVYWEDVDDRLFDLYRDEPNDAVEAARIEIMESFGILAGAGGPDLSAEVGVGMLSLGLTSLNDELAAESARATLDLQAALRMENDAYRQPLETLAVVAIVSLLVMAALARITANWFLVPIERLTTGVSAVRDGLLSTQIEPVRQDELGDLANDFNAMTASLRNLVDDVLKHVDTLGSGAENLRDESVRIRSDAESQVEAVVETSEGVAGVNRSIHGLASASQQLHTAAGRTSQAIRGVDSAMHGIGESMDRVNSALDSSETSAAGISRSTEEIAKAAGQLRDSIDVASGAITGLTASSSELREMAEDCSSVSSETSEVAESGISQARKAAEGARIVSDAFAKISSRVQRLDDRRAEIGSVVAIIDGVAEKTGLLSLNASIIAARAGAEGRGFAVVADEMNDLAAKTRDSTRVIRDLIEAVQDDITATIRAGETGETAVAESGERALEAESAFESVRDRSSVARVRAKSILQASAEAESKLFTLEDVITGTQDIAKQLDIGAQSQKTACVDIQSELMRVAAEAVATREQVEQQEERAAGIASDAREVELSSSKILSAADGLAEESARISEAIAVFEKSCRDAETSAGVLQDHVDSLSVPAEALAEQAGRLIVVEGS